MSERRIHDLITGVTPSENAQVLERVEREYLGSEPEAEPSAKRARLSKQTVQRQPGAECRRDDVIGWQTKIETGSKKRVVFSDCSFKLPPSLINHVLVHGSKVGIDPDWRLVRYMMCFEFKDLDRRA